MSPEIIAALIGAGATLIVGVPTIWYMRAAHKLELHAAWREAHRAQETAEIYRRTITEAPKRFADSLGILIQQASDEIGQSQLVPAARALVAARNGFDSVLDTIKNRLNSEISELERESFQAVKPTRARLPN